MVHLTEAELAGLDAARAESVAGCPGARCPRSAYMTALLQADLAQRSKVAAPAAPTVAKKKERG